MSHGRTGKKFEKEWLILKSKMAELNQNKNSIQRGWPDAAWKLYFILEINE